MVVPVGLQVEVSDNNGHDGIFPGSLGSILQHLERNEALKPDPSGGSEKMASRSQPQQQQQIISKSYAAAADQHLASWSSSLLDKSKEFEQQQQQQDLLHLVSSSSSSMTGTGWSPKSCFFQFAPTPQHQGSSFLFGSSQQQHRQQQIFPVHQKSSDIRRGGSKKPRSSTVAGETPTAETSSRVIKEPTILSSSCRRDESSSSSSIHRGGKMTSLGASPKCNVCSHKPNEARVITFCGHLFCWPCLCCWLHNKSPDKECPVCNQPLTKNHITPLHGRQNSLTVARLQGMLRPEKTSSSSRVHSRGDGAWSRRHQSRISTTNAAAGVAAPAAASKSAPQRVRGIVFDAATPRINASSAENDSSSSSFMRILTRNRSSNFFASVSPPPAVAVPATAVAVSAPAPAAPAVSEPSSSSDRDPVPAPIASSDAAMESTIAEPVLEQDLDRQEQQQLGSTALYAAISTPSTVVTTDVLDDDNTHSGHGPIAVSSAACEFSTEVADSGSEEIRELGVLLSLEWEEAMSAIENAWWDASSEVLNSSSSIADEMGIVDRLSREKETIIHELASEPLKGSNWLASRLESFKTIVSEEIGNRNQEPQELTAMEIEDWFLDSPDEGQVLFPEFVEHEHAEDADVRN